MGYLRNRLTWREELIGPKCEVPPASVNAVVSDAGPTLVTSFPDLLHVLFIFPLDSQTRESPLPSPVSRLCFLEKSSEANVQKFPCVLMGPIKSSPSSGNCVMQCKKQMALKVSVQL